MSKKTSILVSASTHRALRELAEQTSTSVEGVLQQAVEAHRRQLFLKRTNQAFATLRRNTKAWREYTAEIESWDATLQDGL